MPQIPKTGHVVKRSKITPARLKAWEAAIKKGGYKGYTPSRAHFLKCRATIAFNSATFDTGGMNLTPVVFSVNGLLRPEPARRPPLVSIFFLAMREDMAIL